jgi:hypothetical protein
MSYDSELNDRKIPQISPTVNSLSYYYYDYDPHFSNET